MVWACPNVEEATISSLTSRISEGEDGVEMRSFGMVTAKSGNRVCTREDYGLFHHMGEIRREDLYLCCFETLFSLSESSTALYQTSFVFPSLRFQSLLSHFSTHVFFLGRREGMLIGAFWP